MKTSRRPSPLCRRNLIEDQRNKRMIHLLVPMSGQGVRYREAGYNMPKPLVPVSGITMISRVLENFPIEWPAFFVMADNHLQTKLPEELKRLRPNGTIHSVPAHSEGPLR